MHDTLSTGIPLRLLSTEDVGPQPLVRTTVGRPESECLPREPRVPGSPRFLDERSNLNSNVPGWAGPPFRSIVID